MLNHIDFMHKYNTTLSKWTSMQKENYTLEYVIMQTDLQSDSKYNFNTYMEFSLIGIYFEWPFKLAPNVFEKTQKVRAWTDDKCECHRVTQNKFCT
jgi:hypothetical protein